MIWRGRLSGEKQPKDLLTAAGYVAGAVARLRRLGARFLWSRFGVLLLVMLAAVGLAVYRFSRISGLSHSNKLAADLVTGVAALGITTKSVISTLGEITAKAVGPLWDSEIDESCHSPRLGCQEGSRSPVVRWTRSARWRTERECHPTLRSRTAPQGTNAMAL